MTEEDQARIARLQSIDDIIRLKNTYWHFNDSGLLGDKIAALFTEEGVWSNAELGHYVGRSAIRTFFNNLPPELPFCAHLGMNPIIDVDGDHATGRWRALLLGTFVEEGRKQDRIVLIDYVDDFVRIDGTWFIRKLDILFNFNVPFQSSWAGLEQVRQLS